MTTNTTKPIAKKILINFLVSASIFVVGASLHDFAHIRTIGSLIAYSSFIVFPVTTILVLMKREPFFYLKKLMDKYDTKKTLSSIPYYGHIQKYLNQTSVYSAILFGITLFFGYIIFKVVPFHVQLLALDGKPFPSMSELYFQNHQIFTLSYATVFLLLFFTGAKEGKSRVISHHIMVLTVISKLFYLLFFSISLILPLIKLTEKMTIG